MLDYVGVAVDDFDEASISHTRNIITIPEARYKGISAYEWNPSLRDHKTQSLSVAYFGGVIEHWNTFESIEFVIISGKQRTL